MVHSSFYRPRIFSVTGDVADAEIDRAQGIDITVSSNRDKIEEIGRDGVVGYLKKSPTVGYRLTQLEYGNIEFYQKLVNSTTLGANGQTEITLNDFKTPYFDICAYLTDDDGTFKGTLWYPKLRTSGFSLTIGEPQGMIERGFDFVGERALTLQGDNKYLIVNRHEAGSAGDDVIDLSGKAPAEHPDNAGQYMFRVVRISSGVTTELVETTDYSYSDGAKELTIVSIQSADVIKSYYSSATAPDNEFTLNDADVAGLVGDSVSIYLYIPGSGKPSASDYIYRLQSVTLDVTLDREDVREIGNKEVVQRGVRTSTVTVTLGRILESFTVEEVLRGEVADYGIIDVEKLSDNIALIVKIFDDNTKGTFKYGFKATGLTPTEMRPGAGVNEYVKKDNSLEGEALIISADSSVIGI